MENEDTLKPPSKSGSSQGFKALADGAFRIGVAFLVLILIAWQILAVGDVRMKDFRASEQVIARHSATAVARHLAWQLKERKRLAALFRDNELQRLRLLIANPENDGLRADIEARAKDYFPDSFAFTLADSHGDLLLDEFEGKVDGLCLIDIGRAARGLPPEVRIHPNTVRYHYDVTLPYSIDGKDGVFFLSFGVEDIARLLKAASKLKHELWLVNFNDEPLIEVTPAGARDHLQRDDFRLQPEELERVMVSVPVEGTSWQVVDLRDPDLYLEQEKGIYRFSAMLFAGFLVTTLLLMSGSMVTRSRD